VSAASAEDQTYCCVKDIKKNRKIQGPFGALKPSSEISRTLLVNLKKKKIGSIENRTLNSFPPATITEQAFPS